MKANPLFPLLLALLTLQSVAAEPSLQQLDDEELGAINARQGVLISLNFRNNLKADNSPNGCIAPSSFPVASANPCRLGIEFANRNGKWLMLKEFYGTFQVNELRLDAGTLPNVATTYADENRFKSGSTCLLGAGMSPCLPTGRPTMKFSYPGSDNAAIYADFSSLLNIGRVWLEFDNGSTPGFQRDTTDRSLLGVRMSDAAIVNDPARMRFRGTAYVYGF